MKQTNQQDHSSYEVEVKIGHNADMPNDKMIIWIKGTSQNNDRFIVKYAAEIEPHTQFLGY